MAEEERDLDKRKQRRAGEKTIACRRTGRVYDLTECPRCPYCFGTESDVTNCDPATFCDFHPGQDPTHFGFPGGDSRTLHG